ncbi:E3 ubiquitin-protein ligase RNF4 [Carex littledalei]|uniref:E3 ubiquitin-protein ligase RNF4 n=1 Tax=Carex littledalei TaxID=544730 RepID=A0A833VFW0_9POAL|nr:E3 ubiquitin-protein ligase RNF4 [Carex littledalei]
MSSSLRSLGRQSYKRRGTRQSKRENHIIIDLNSTIIDLNSPAPGADVLNVASSSRSFQHALSNPSPIFVDDTDDDVQMLSTSIATILAPSQVSMHAPIVVLDEEEEINPGPSGVVREARDRTINLDLSLDLDTFGSVLQRKDEVAPSTTLNLIPMDLTCASIPMEPPQVPPKEPTFSCPVCMNALVEPSSTICGHIFCKECIKASIQAQKKCPTCRKQLNMRNFHRVYLPSTE